MSGVQLPIYRLPTATSTSVGWVRVIKDRKNRYHVDGSTVASASEIGDYTSLVLEDGRTFYVRTADLGKLAGPKR